MPLNRKFANVPGIASDQPEVFETIDLPESDRYRYLPEELVSESVEQIELEPNVAFKRFEGCVLASSDVDFSDRISSSRKTGYRIEMENDDEPAELAPRETLTIKLNRIKSEIEGLIQQLKDDSTVYEPNKTGTDDQLSREQLALLVDGLWGQLQDSDLDNVLGPESEVDLNDPEGCLSKKLVEKLSSYDSKCGKANGSGQPETTDSDKVVYNLTLAGDPIKNTDLAKLSELDSRMQNLESLLVGSKPKAAGSAPLLQLVSTVTARSALLEPVHIEHLDARLAALLQRLQSLSDRREISVDADTRTKVAELYGLVKKWDHVCDDLPNIVERLAGLSDLHDQAMQFSYNLTSMDSNQQQVMNALKSHEDILQKLSGSLIESVDTVKTNSDALNSRIDKLDS